MSNHPNWVIDLINAVDEYEDLHEHKKEGGHCLQAWLIAIPEEVLTAARQVRAYRGTSLPAEVENYKAVVCDKCGVKLDEAHLRNPPTTTRVYSFAQPREEGSGA